MLRTIKTGLKVWTWLGAKHFLSQNAKIYVITHRLVMLLHGDHLITDAILKINQAPAMINHANGITHGDQIVTGIGTGRHAKDKYRAPTHHYNRCFCDVSEHHN